MSEKMGIQVVVDGEKEFSSAIRNINGDMKMLESELRAATAEFGRNDKSLEGLTAKSKLYTKEVEVQKSKVSLLTDQYDKQWDKLEKLYRNIETATKLYGENSKEVEKAKKAYDDQEKSVRKLDSTLTVATSTLNKLEKQMVENETLITTQSSKWAGLGRSLDETGKKINGVGEGITSAGAKLSLGLTAPIIAAGAVMVNYASDLSENMNKTSVAFGENAKDVTEWSETTLGAYGISQNSALEMASLFGDMGTAMGQSTNEAATMSTSLVGLAGDLASFKNIGLDQAQDALKGIFTGEGEALKSLGIIMQDSTLQAYALATGQGKAYSEMDQAEKVALRYSYVMDATKNSQGDFARTSDGTANSIRTMQESVKELGASFGEELLPVITPMIRELTKMVKGFGDLDPEMKKTIVTTAGIAAAIGPAVLVIGGLTQGVGLAVSAVGTVSGAIGVMTTGAVAATPAVAGLAGAMTVLTGPVGIVIGALGLLTVGGVALHEVLTKGKQLTEEQIKANDAFIASSTAVAGAVATNITARSDSIKASQDEAMAAQELSVKLFDLADKQNKSGAEMQLLTSYVDQFNQLMPNANLLIDEQTGALNLTRDATNELIAAETERIQKQAVNEALVQNAKDQLATKREMNEAQIRQNQLEQEYAQGMQAVIDGEGNKNEKQQKINELTAKYNEQLGPVTESVKTLTAKQGELATEQGTLNGLLADPSGWNAFITGTNTASQAVVTFADGTTTKISELGTTAPILMAQTGANSTIALQNSLIAGTPGITVASQGAHDTITTTIEPIVPELAKTGDDGAHGLGQSILNQQPWIKTNSQLAHDTVNDTTTPLVGELTDTGNKSGLGLGQALQDQNPWIGINSTLIHDTTKNTIDPLTGELTTIGGDSGQGFGDALASKNETAGASGQLIHDNVKGKFSPLPGVIRGYGEDSGDGYIGGFNSKEKAITDGSNSLVQKVLTTFRTALGIQSPSTEFREIAEDSMDGWLGGWDVDTMVAFANGIVEDIKEAFANKKFSLQGAVEFIGSGAAEFFKSIGIGGASFSGLTVPVGGAITSGFGYRDDVAGIGTPDHMGIDIGAAEGTPVGAAGAGMVTQAGWNGGYGNSVTIDHGNGLETLYGHLSQVLVGVGDLVSQLQTIGLVGSTGNSTGPHLHFGVYQDGAAIDPSSLWGFDVGSRYIPYDMPAMVHQGEMIIPKSENPYANSGGQITPTGTKIEFTQNNYSPETIKPSQSAKLAKRAMRDLVLSL